ncbi:MAG: hypothetical protein ABIN61_03940 [candidate division WOR-3 bacterium]
MLFYLIFSVLLNIDGENYCKIYRSSNEVDLFFIEKGFFTPTLGLGIIGADLNPATLGKAPNTQFIGAISIFGKTKIDLEKLSFEVEREDETKEKVEVINRNELYGEYSTLGGINFLGFAKKFGMVGIGVSYGAGYRVGGRISLSGSLYGNFHLDEPLKLTHEDISEIEYGDTVKVNPLFKGAFYFDNPIPLRVEYSDFPIFLGTGINIGPLGLGVGLKLQNCKLVGEGNFSARIDSLVCEVNDTTVTDDDGDTWIVRDFSAALDLKDDLFRGEIHSSGFSATHPVFTLGMLFTPPILKLSFGFDFGANYELKGPYSWSFSRISELPEDFVSVDSTNLTIIQDSLVTGRAIIRIDSMIREENSESGEDYTLQFSGSSFNFGALLDLPVKLGFNGRLTFPADYTLSKIGTCLYFGIPVPLIDIDFGLAADAVIVGGKKTEELNWVIIPTAELGLTFSYERDYLKFYLPIKYDITHLALSIMTNIIQDELKDEEDVNLELNRSSSVFNNLAFGFSFMVKI